MSLDWLLLLHFPVQVLCLTWLALATAASLASFSTLTRSSSSLTRCSRCSASACTQRKAKPASVKRSAKPLSHVHATTSLVAAMHNFTLQVCHLSSVQSAPCTGFPAQQALTLSPASVTTVPRRQPVRVAGGLIHGNHELTVLQRQGLGQLRDCCQRLLRGRHQTAGLESVSGHGCRCCPPDAAGSCGEPQAGGHTCVQGSVIDTRCKPAYNKSGR